MRKIYSIFSIFLAMLSMTACSDSDDDAGLSASLNYYGLKFNIGGGMLWENNPNLVLDKEPFFYLDTYKNAEGMTVTDSVKGFAAGQKTRQTGNFQVTLYEDCMSFNEELKNYSGTGACVCFHLASPDPDKLVPGKYVYQIGKNENTFTAYSSAVFNSLEEIGAAIINEGEVDIAQDGDIYTLDFNCKNTLKGVISGTYKGQLNHQKIDKQSILTYDNVKMDALLDSVVVLHYYGDELESREVSFDTENASAFFSTYRGITKVAKDKEKELVDLALRWNAETYSVEFTSPIFMRQHLGHDATYHFPCHTVYMPAPADFTDDDFRNLDAKDLNVDIVDQKVSFDLHSFRPGYVFFKTGDGVMGVIKVKRGVEPSDKVTEDTDTGTSTVTSGNPCLFIDIKCPTSFVDAKIR